MFSMQLASRVSTLALFGALASGGAMAAVVVGPPSCPGQTNSGDRTSAVTSQVILGASNTYNFRVCNTSGSPNEEFQTVFLLRDWELPWDPAGDINNIVTPNGWDWSIETIGQANMNTGWDGQAPTWLDPNDPFYDARYANLTQVLHYYTCGSGGCYGEASANAPALRPGEELEGFGFTSIYEPTNAPYQASWVDFIPRSGDPAFPLVGANTPGIRIPEPSGLALFALSLGGLMAARARRRQDSQG